MFLSLAAIVCPGKPVGCLIVHMAVFLHCCICYANFSQFQNGLHFSHRQRSVFYVTVFFFFYQQMQCLEMKTKTQTRGGAII